MSYGRLPDTAPTPLQTIADLSRRIVRLQEALDAALVDADAWRDRARRMDRLVEDVERALTTTWPGRTIGDTFDAALEDLARARKVWEEAT